LRQAAQASVRVKIAGSDGGGEQSSFGRIQAGVAAAFLGMPEEAYGRLKVMAVKRSMNPSLITSHEPNADIFNTDGNGGIPQIVDTLLLASQPGRIDLLPALPAAWPAGSVKGLRARGGFTVDIEWNDRRVTHYRVASNRPQPVTVSVNGELKTVKSTRL
jgi:alpha-L-fucosidase 2